jgi:glycosyltransferase involved in cell wall biosynthesis
MRIGFDAKRAFTNFTGLGNYSRFIIKVLSENFPKNEYWLYTPKLDRNSEVDTLLAHPNIKVQSPPLTYSLLKLQSLWRTMRIGNHAIKNKVELFHGLSNELPVFKNKQVKTIVTIHDLLFIRYPEFYKKVDVEIYRKKFQYACQKADKIIAVSNQTALDIQELLNMSKEKIEVVYQGVKPAFKLEYDPISQQRVKDTYKLPDDYLLNVGTIEPRKNALLIVKALASIKNTIDIPLVIVGKSTKYKNEIVEYAKKEQILDRIIFLHDVNYKDLPNIYQLSRTFIYPSIFEGFGIPIIEALYSKVPVITSKGSCFSEAGGPASLYINPQNHEELADAILSILNNTALASKMITKGLEHTKQFEDDVIASKIMDVYQKVLRRV